MQSCFREYLMCSFKVAETVMIASKLAASVARASLEYGIPLHFSTNVLDLCACFGQAAHYVVDLSEASLCRDVEFACFFCSLAPPG